MENKKKGKKSIIVIAISLLLIAIGAVLIITGNNKSFLNDDDKTKGNNVSDDSNKTDDNNQTDPIDDEPNRDVIINPFTEQDAINLIFEKKNQEFSNEQWNIGTVTIIAHDETNEKYLINYEKLDDNGEITTLQTIASVLGESRDVELPGWVPGERDLSVYNFIYVDNNENNDVTIPENNVEENQTEDQNENQDLNNEDNIDNENNEENQ